MSEEEKEGKEKKPLRREDLLPFGSGRETAIGCSVLVVLLIVGFWVWRGCVGG